MPIDQISQPYILKIYGKQLRSFQGDINSLSGLKKELQIARDTR